MTLGDQLSLAEAKAVRDEAEISYLRGANAVLEGTLATAQFAINRMEARLDPQPSSQSDSGDEVSSTGLTHDSIDVGITPNLCLLCLCLQCELSLRLILVVTLAVSLCPSQTTSLTARIPKTPSLWLSGASVTRSQPMRLWSDLEC